ncbi:hypothetical protein QBC43DRAFT_338541 [Cladorrhinum sp. PSN259]|nr:hypothetical protein QBC43DRAFT_338541 [Cladorrhinum sp. PSN259]
MPGGLAVVLNGTVEQVHTQLLEINPNYEADFADIMAAKDAERNLTRRQQGIDDVFCNNWLHADLNPIMDGIRYLHRVPGRPQNGPGFGDCGRVSCSWKSAIWWCNDNTDSKILDNFDEIAESARDVVAGCTIVWYRLVSGQRFHPDKWNVIVRHDSHHLSPEQGREEECLYKLVEFLQNKRVEVKPLFKMKPFAALSVVILPFLAQHVSTSPVDRGGKIAGYKTVEMSWEVEIAPGGPTMIMNGTVQQVHAQLLQVNPNYDSDFAQITAARKAAAAAATITTRVLKRDPHTDCDIYDITESALKFRILEGVDYLHHVRGQPFLGPGPRTCSRVSCSYGSAILWCNDSPDTKTLPSFDIIADAANEIVTNCPEMDTPALGVYTISGQRWFDDQWNVIVRGTRC